ncbi:MAG: ATP-binding protein [Deltaproteobacteria bacterium]|nr:ATP-binding protein [Deltaproteobacteria bacterium]MBW1951623.1 ATP-binding protein [Deltaproteobacteria bacterium]MBW1986640.1 ATP-binding protein [Deltaproteobacteria bacterium]MBW2134759.1 ATP-binding protein [Deltaproteobacteria bacterium]
MTPFFRLTQIRMRTLILGIIITALVISSAFFFLGQRIRQRVETLVTEQFNQQQLTLARKIADSIEFYFDYLEAEMLSYSHFSTTERHSLDLLREYLKQHFSHLQTFGILEVRKYDANGQLEYCFGQSLPCQSVETRKLNPRYHNWLQNPKHHGMLYLTTTFLWPEPPWKGRKVMAMLSPLYLYQGRTASPEAHESQKERFAGCLELIFDPYYICREATKDVRSGQTGYTWIIDADETVLAHYETEFLGKDAIRVRQSRAPQLSFERLKKIQKKILQGKEGMDWYESGWHRERLGRIKKLVAFVPVRFDRGLIKGVLTVENRQHNLWGVAVVAPVEEVYGLIRSFQTQETLLGGFFFLLILAISGVFIGTIITWNKTLTKEVELKTEALKQSHERLLRSERFAAVGEAAAYVSHEIKNPLMVIGGFARQLERNPQLKERDREKVKIIGDEVARLETFLGDLRDFTRPAPPAKQMTDLNAIVHEIEEMMREAADECGVQLVTSLNPDLPPALLDPNQIKQVLINLIKNAIEATEGKGHVVISTRFQEDHLHLSVKDDGKGIRPEILRDIFNPFFTTKEAGTGLGLSVINKIVEDHQGTITVESTLGKGSTFTVILPCNP